MRISFFSVPGSLRNIIVPFLQLFLPLALICLIGTVALFKSKIETNQTKISTIETAAVQLGVNTLERVLQSVTSDLGYMAIQDGFIDMIADEGHPGHHHPEVDWPVFSGIKEIHDQIRWLDTNGQERLRVNYNSGNPTAVPEDKLQNKAERYYFTDTIKLEQGEFFISPLDLNIEHGKIEQPRKPMIRIGTPVFDREGEKQGIILLNYLGEKMLQEFARMMGTANDRTWLLNREGYWLKGPSPDLEWGFMYDRPELTMAHRYPETWRQINTADVGQFEDEHGLWTFASVYPLIESQKTSIGTHNSFEPRRSDLESSSYIWKTVLLLPHDEYYAKLWQTNISLIIVTIVLLVGLFIACWHLASARVHQEETEEEVLRANQGLERTVKKRTQELQEAIKLAEHQARTDELTGMNNRRSFFEYGKLIDEQARRYGRPYSVIMLDIDWFKQINDNYGHLVGDKTLKKVATTIPMVIRASDIAGRIGGEEFSIILPETSIEDTRKFAERLRQSVADIDIPVDDGDVNITASLGIAEYQSENASFDDVLAQADNALYQAKDKGRNRVVLFQS
jgi:diguanylate cyclase (GGDEF)-like protein